MKRKTHKRKIVSLFLFILSMLIILIGIYQTKWVQAKLYPLLYRENIENYSKEYHLDPYLVMSVIYVESGFKPKSISSHGAIGLMQIMPKTGEWIADKMKLKNFQNEMLYDETYNIKLGCWYLKNLQEQYNNDQVLLLAAYNAGSGNVNRWLSLPQHSADGKTLYNIPYKETRNYIDKVMKAYNKYKWIYKK